MRCAGPGRGEHREKIVIKWLLRIVVALVVLLIVVVVVGLFVIDGLAKAGLEKGATYALGVETRAEDLSLSLLGGSLRIDGLRVANPPGFTDEELLRSGRFELALRPASVFTDTIELEKFELDGLTLAIEQKASGSNVSKIMDNLKKFDTDKGKEADKPESEGKKVKVDRIVIRDIVAKFRLVPGLSAAGPLTVKVPEIVLTDVSSEDGRGVVVAELVRRILPAVLKAVFEQGRGVIPGDFLDGLDTQLTGLAEGTARTAEQALDRAKGELDKVIGGEGAKAVGDALKGIIGGDKKAKDPN